MLKWIVVVVVLLGAARARRSPNAALLEKVLQTSDLAARYSDNLIEDAFLDVPDLVRKYGYPVEEHTVTTEDGYILGVHRIPHGRGQRPAADRPVVFVMHGLLSSSADFIIMGPGIALAYILADAGFDVWLGNARGTYYSRRHVFLNPNNRRGSYWDFSWDEIGQKDLPAMIDYVLRETDRAGLHYIGMSQGTTVFFVMGSLRPEYNSKIITMHALAPVAYMANNQQKILKTVATFGNVIETILAGLGFKELLPNNIFMTLMGIVFCSDTSVFQPICSGLIFAIAGKNPIQHNATMLPAKLGHAPAGCALRQIVHYAQSLTDKDFRRYDHGSVANLVNYGTFKPPKYDLSRITAPSYLHYSHNDPLAEVRDVTRLYNELGGPKYLMLVKEPNFSHIDFMWGIDAKSIVFDTVVDIIRAHPLAHP